MEQQNTPKNNEKQFYTLKKNLRKLYTPQSPCFNLVSDSDLCPDPESKP